MIVIPVVYDAEGEDTSELDHMLDTMIGQPHSEVSSEGNDHILFYHFKTEAEANRAEHVISMLQKPLPTVFGTYIAGGSHETPRHDRRIPQSP